MQLEEIFIHLFTKYLLKVYHMSDTVLCPYLLLLGAYILIGEFKKQTKQIKQYVR